MNKVRTIIRITELDSLSDLIVRLYKADKSIAADEYLKSLMAEIESLSAKITSAIKKDKIVSTLSEADKERDKVISSLKTLLNGYAVIPFADKKSAAEKLLAVFSKYKEISWENYLSESSLIESMLQDFAAPSLSAEIERLEGVAEYLADLRKAQDAFNKASDEYTAAQLNKGKNATSLKKPLFDAINNKLIPYLVAMELSNSSLYGNFISMIQAEIEGINASIARRIKPKRNPKMEASKQDSL